MKRIFLITVSIFLTVSLMAQNIKIEKPTSKKGNTFAIVIDNTTFSKTKSQVYAYRDALQKDGLSTYIVSGDWENPDQVRNELKKLYKKSKNFEGIVLIGDIPVAMVRNAQHMTTAFKMDEDKFPMNESSVGSDRFYDDLNLEFEFITRDTVDTDFFYYNLKTDCAQHLNPTYYSGRIKYPKMLGGDKYEAIARFLEKAVAAKENPELLDNIVTFAGHGYNSDCLITWMDESITIEENFPFLKNNSRNFKQLNFRHEDYMKYRLFGELQRPEVDAFFFNEHGSIDKQHISEFPAKETPKDYAEKYRRGWGWNKGPYDILKAELGARKKAGATDAELADYETKLKDTLKRDFHVTDKFFEAWDKEQKMSAEERKEAQAKAKKENNEIIITLDDLKPLATQPYFVVFNACYNGSFHRPGSIGAYYIFGKGRTIAIQGNTVNVLQDRWTYEDVGIISLGARVGEYNRLVATLEGHIVGDPTFHFKSSGETFRGEIAANANNIPYWREKLLDKYAPVQCVALRKLFELKAITPAELLGIMKESTFGTVRMECLKLISRSNDNNVFVEALNIAIKDNYEVVRRQAASLIGRNGDPRLSDALISEYVNFPEQKRVHYNSSGDFFTMKEKELVEAVEKAKPSMTYLDKDEVVNDVVNDIKRNAKRRAATIEEIMDKSLKDKERISSIRTTRNYNLHPAIPQFIELVADKENPLEIRLNMAEALGWYIYSYRKQEIIDGFNKILKEQAQELDPKLKAEMIQTINRLK